MAKSPPPAPAPAPPPPVAIRHPGPWPVAFGAYATGVVHQVDAATAERLLARGFVRVTGATPAPAETAPTAPAATLFPADPAAED